MTTLGFYAACRHAAICLSDTRLNYEDKKLYLELQGRDSLPVNKSRHLINLDKKEVTELAKRMNSYGDTAKSSVTVFVLEKWLLSKGLINYNISEVSPDKYELVYQVIGRPVISCFVYKEDYVLSELETYYAVLLGYKIKELVGTNEYIVTTDEGSQRLVRSGACDCREFTLVNGRKRPCRHIRLITEYQKDRARFSLAGVSELLRN